MADTHEMFNMKRQPKEVVVNNYIKNDEDVKSDVQHLKDQMSNLQKDIDKVDSKADQSLKNDDENKKALDNYKAEDGKVTERFNTIEKEVKDNTAIKEHEEHVDTDLSELINYSDELFGRDSKDNN